MVYYHVNRFHFGDGTIIYPGAWGRPILYGRSYSAISNPSYYILFREYVFEEIRRTLFPEKPSRLQSTFVCPNLESAHNFNEIERGNGEVVYRLELAGEGATHTADWTLTNPPQSLESAYITVPRAAEQYWSYPQNPPFPQENVLETLVAAPLRICGVEYLPQ